MKRMVFSAIVLTGIILFAPMAIAVERNVPSEYATIQAAINASINGDIVIIAPGTFYENVQIINKGITLTSENPNDSGIVESTIINGGQSGSVITINSAALTVTIAGLTITNGLAHSGGGIKCFTSSDVNLVITNCRITSNWTASGSDGTSSLEPAMPGGDGAGIYCSTGVNLNIKECTLANNICGKGGDALNEMNTLGAKGGRGGGIYFAGSSLKIKDCQIMSNTCGNGGNGAVMYGGTPGNGGEGGGLFSQNCSLDINNCLFEDNTAGTGGRARFYGGNGGKGGGIYSVSPSAIIKDSRFIGNISGYAGGCQWCDGLTQYSAGDGGGVFQTGSMVIENCLIIQNTAGGATAVSDTAAKSGNGGGIFCTSSDIKSCTVTDNTIAASSQGGEGGGIYSGSGVSLRNSIIWNNNAQANPQIFGSPAVIYSDVQDGFAGTGNINADPCFVSGPDGDYYLSQVKAGQAFDSPCVNSGSNTAADLGMNLKTTRTDRIGDSGIVDLGYHYLNAIYVGSPDLDGNGVVNFIDYVIFANDWQQTSDPCNPKSSDIIKDGRVDIYDLGVFVESWLAGSTLVPIEPNLVGWWKFDEGNGTIAYDSAGHNNGAISGGAAWTTGQINGALNFDGSDDYVSVPDIDNSLDMDNQMTITAWIMLNNDSEIYSIVDKQPSEAGSGNYHFLIMSSGLYLLHQTGTGEEAGYVSTSSVTAGVWQHVAVTLKEGDSVKFYINGTPAGTSQTETFGFVNNGPVLIGTSSDFAIPFDGAIDEVRIYNRVLTAGEVASLYQQ